MSDRESLCLHLFRVGADGPFLNVADRLWQHANGRQKCDKARKVLAPHGLGQAAGPPARRDCAEPLTVGAATAPRDANAPRFSRNDDALAVVSRMGRILGFELRACGLIG
jgi:hypothetical protein